MHYTQYQDSLLYIRVRMYLCSLYSTIHWVHCEHHWNNKWRGRTIGHNEFLHQAGRLVLSIPHTLHNTALHIQPNVLPSYMNHTVPVATVGNIQGSVSDSGLTVTFDTLTDPNDARGNVTYVVCYTLDGETQRTCVTTASSPVTIPGVPRNRAYTITITPETIAGVGTESQATLVGELLQPTNMQYMYACMCVFTVCTMNVLSTSMYVRMYVHANTISTYI